MVAFVTVDEYAAATRTDLYFDDNLEAAVRFALEAACDEIRRATSQDFDLIEDDVIVLDGTGHAGLLLPQLPVVAINSVTIDKDLTTEVVVTDWVLGFGGILRRRGTQTVTSACHRRRVWPWGFGNITLDYDHGYGAYEGEQFPSDLKNVAIQMAFSGITEEPGITSETIAGYSYTREASAATLDTFCKVIDRYTVKRIPVA